MTQKYGSYQVSVFRDRNYRMELWVAALPDFPEASISAGGRTKEEALAGLDECWEMIMGILLEEHEGEPLQSLPPYLAEYKQLQTHAA